MTGSESFEQAVTGAVLGEHVFMTYADFGRRFFETAVTRRRIESATAGLVGRTIEFGPTGVGPIGLVRVRADGTVGTPTVDRVAGEHIAFELTVPVDLRLTIEIGPDKNRFTAEVKVRIGLTARPAEPLQIVIDIQPPTRHDVDVTVRAEGLRASVLQAVAGVEGEVRRTVAKVVGKEIESPSVQEARVIDIARALESLHLPD